MLQDLWMYIMLAYGDLISELWKIWAALAQWANNIWDIIYKQGPSLVLFKVKFQSL